MPETKTRPPQNVQTVTNNIRARVKYIHGSQLVRDKLSYVNKQNVPCLRENNFPNLQPPSSSFNWQNRKKINPTTPNPRKIDQSRHRNDGNSLFDRIFQGCKIRFLHKFTNIVQTYRLAKSIVDKIAIIFLLIASRTSNEITQEDANICLAVPSVHTQQVQTTRND
jgi:hypothetical protein